MEPAWRNAIRSPSDQTGEWDRTMHAKQVLHRILNQYGPGMHRTRRESLSVNVLAALRGKSLAVTSIGRSIRSTAKEKHCIKL